jgi:ribonucleoside-diphosphate reductase alpha chain
MHGPKSIFSQQLHAKKYRQENESFRECVNRISAALKEDDEHHKKLRDMLLDMRWMPGGRVQASAGSMKHVTPYNCSVSGTINDSFVDGENSIMQIVTEAVATMRLGSGIGYDFSTLRPFGDVIKKLQSSSSGPINIMDIFDAACSSIKSAGHRQGAQMGVMRVDHPDIERFIMAKQPDSLTQMLWDAVGSMDHGNKFALVEALQKTLKLTNFNLSIAITDEFMECLYTGSPFALRFGGKVYREIDAAALNESIMRANWDWGEPGVLFIDTINKMNNLSYCETIAATNPCGEQPLPPYGLCLLGSFNLPRYISKNSSGEYYFEWDQFIDDIPAAVSALDNVVDRAIYPLSKHKEEATTKRRMGLGITGLANAGEALGFPYGSKEFLMFESRVLDLLRDTSYMASSMIAKKKGAFPLYLRKKYLAAPFIKTLRPDVIESIRLHGIRNSHLTSIAPTGTISLCADNVSSGIEPVSFYHADRKINLNGTEQIEKTVDYGYGTLGVSGKVCSDVSVDEHLDVLFSAAHRVDSAVSKTCNIGGQISWDDFKGIYYRAWSGGAKGCTTYRSEGKRSGIMTASTSEPAAQCKIDPATGRKDCD